MKDWNINELEFVQSRYIKEVIDRNFLYTIPDVDAYVKGRARELGLTWVEKFFDDTGLQMDIKDIVVELRNDIGFSHMIIRHFWRPTELWGIIEGVDGIRFGMAKLQKILLYNDKVIYEKNALSDEMPEKKMVFLSGWSEEHRAYIYKENP